jgi:integrase
VPRAQSAGNVARIIAACKDDRERAVIWLMVGLGLRRMEVAGLRWEHHDDRARIVEVRHSKFGRERLLPVTDEVHDALERLRGGGMTGPIIRSARDPHQGISVERVGQIAAEVMKRAGVKQRAYDGCSGHALRHTAASDVLDRSHDLRVVQAMLGHEALSSTAVYLRRATPEQLRDAMGGRGYEGAA